MNLDDLKSRLLGDASWNEPEAWPRQTQWLVTGIISVVFAVALSAGFVWPAWSELQKARSKQAEVEADWTKQSTLLTNASVRREELKQLRRGRVDPMSMETVTAVFEASSPQVGVAEAGGFVTVDGDGSFLQLEKWLTGISDSPSIPLWQWKNLRIESDGSALSWAGQLQRAEKPAEPTTPGSDSHAVTVGRDPFGSLIAVPAAGESSDSVPVAVSLPNEDAWPRPSVRDWPTDALRMVGTIGSSAPRVLLMAGSKSLYVVRAGESIGRERHVIRQILSHRVIAGTQTLMLTPQMIERAP